MFLQLDWGALSHVTSYRGTRMESNHGVRARYGCFLLSELLRLPRLPRLPSLFYICFLLNCWIRTSKVGGHCEVFVDIPVAFRLLVHF